MRRFLEKRGSVTAMKLRFGFLKRSREEFLLCSKRVVASGFPIIIFETALSAWHLKRACA
jgi:hypothetical protein